MNTDILSEDREREVIGIIKESMINGQRRNTEYNNLLKEQIELLKSELRHKDEIIKLLILSGNVKYPDLCNMTTKYPYHNHPKVHGSAGCNRLSSSLCDHENI